MNRTNRILLALLLLQLGLIVFADRPWPSSPYPTESGDEVETLFFPEFASDAAVAIELVQGMKSMTLRKSAAGDDAWLAYTDSGLPFSVAPFKVRALLDCVAGLEKREIVSRSAEKKEVFGVDVQSALHLIVEGADSLVLARLCVGRNLGPLHGTYVSLPAGDEVYIVRENILYACTGKDADWVSFWRDDTVFSFEPAAVVSLQVKGPGGSFIAERVSPAIDGAAGWKIECSDPAREVITAQQVDKMLELICTFRVQGEAPSGANAESLGLADPEIEIELKLNTPDSAVQKLALSREEAGFRYLMLNQDTSVFYKVNSYPFHLLRLR
ncbi:MAG: DUF4340 domain-containing protein [Planctomycetota bacterium]